MEYGAIDVHKKESQVRIMTEGGDVIDRRIATTRGTVDDALLGSPTCPHLDRGLHGE